MTENSQTAPPLPPNVEPHDANHAARLNVLRAGVLGANDGIVSVAGIVIGVAGATMNQTALVTAGVAGLVAGALSMAVGEYVSVSTQRDTEKALIAKETAELRDYPEEELEELTKIYEGKGLDRQLAEQVARELTEHDALAAHAEVELGIDPEDYTDPWHAAISSAVSFTLGALIPFLTMVFLPVRAKIGGTVAGVVVALALTGYLSAHWGGAPKTRPILRNVIGGLLAMGVTYWIGRLVGVAV